MRTAVPNVDVPGADGRPERLDGRTEARTKVVMTTGMRNGSEGRRGGSGLAWRIKVPKT